MPNTLIEIWKPCFERPDYEISTTGRVRRKGKVLRTSSLGRNGYPVCNIGRGNTKYVHLLVLETFVGICPKGKCARHLNDIKRDNRLENLAWGSRLENYNDALKNRKVKRFNGKLTEQQVSCIKYGNEHYAKAAKRYNCSIWNIFKIRANISWQEV